MAESIINIGDRIEIYRAGGTNSEEKHYASQLLDFPDTNKANISMPIENGHVVPLTPGIRYEICFFTKMGMFRCKAIITERFKTENIYMLTVEFLTGLEKFQRRQYFRLACIKDVYYRAYTENEEKLEKSLENRNYHSPEERKLWENALSTAKNDFTLGTISDLSGGGLRFGANHTYEKNTTLIVRFEIKDEGVSKVLELKARVVASEKSSNPNWMYENRMEFIEIDGKTRETLVKYIFNEERQQRKRTIN